MRVIITGGPGAGKTTLLRELASRGYATVDESARGIIAERLAAGQSPRPTTGEFVREILRRDMEKYRQSAGNSHWVFFDRSVLEAICMVHALLPIPDAQLASLLTQYRFHSTVFLLPPWEQIYTTDAERDQTFADAVAVHARIVEWYGRCGYRVQEVPRSTAAERAAHVLAHLGEDGNVASSTR